MRREGLDLETPAPLNGKDRAGAAPPPLRRGKSTPNKASRWHGGATRDVLERHLLWFRTRYDEGRIAAAGLEGQFVPYGVRGVGVRGGVRGVDRGVVWAKRGKEDGGGQRGDLPLRPCSENGPGTLGPEFGSTTEADWRS